MKLSISAAFVLLSVLLSGCIASNKPFDLKQALRPSDVITATKGAVPDLKVKDEAQRVLRLGDADVRLYPGTRGLIAEFLFTSNGNVFYVYGYVVRTPSGVDLYLDQFGAVAAARDAQDALARKLKPSLPEVYRHATLVGDGAASIFVPKSIQSVEAIYLALIAAGLPPMNTISG
jgi:hypothetical protein